MPPCHRHRGDPHRPVAGLDQLPSLDQARGGRGGRRALEQRCSRSRSAKTSPASSTPAGPAARRAESCSTTARCSTTSQARPTSSRPTSAGTTRFSCPSCRQATPTSIPAGSFPDRARRANLLCREPRKARRQHRGGAADDHGRRAAPVRNAARADPEDGRRQRRRCRSYLFAARARDRRRQIRGPAEAVGPADGRHPVADASQEGPRASSAGG